MNTYALALARKWNQISSDYKSFTAFSKAVRKASHEFNEIDKFAKNLNKPTHMLGYFFSDAFPMAIPALLIFLITANHLPFEPNLTNGLLTILALYSVTFPFRYFYMLPRSIKNKKEELNTITKPFDYSIAFQIAKPENLQKILPVLEMYIIEDAVKDILIRCADNSLTYDDTNLIFIALNKYYKEQVNTKNFLSIITEIEKEDISHKTNDTEKNENLENTNQKDNDELDIENIRFFVK